MFLWVVIPSMWEVRKSGEGNMCVCLARRGGENRHVRSITAGNTNELSLTLCHTKKKNQLQPHVVDERITDGMR